MTKYLNVSSEILPSFTICLQFWHIVVHRVNCTHKLLAYKPIVLNIKTYHILSAFEKPILVVSV